MHLLYMGIVLDHKSFYFLPLLFTKAAIICIGETSLCLEFRNILHVVASPCASKNIQANVPISAFL